MTLNQWLLIFCGGLIILALPALLFSALGDTCHAETKKEKVLYTLAFTFMGLFVAFLIFWLYNLFTIFP